MLLTHFEPIFYNLWKRQKNRGFLKFSGGIDMEHWPDTYGAFIRFFGAYQIKVKKLNRKFCWTW